MLRARIDKGYRVVIPETLRSSLKVGDELLITVDQAGRILMLPESRVKEILENTAGLWRNRQDIPSDSIQYVNELRQGRRLNDLGVTSDERS